MTAVKFITQETPKGKGVFTSAPIRAGEFLFSYRGSGPLLTYPEAKGPSREAYCLQIGHDKYIWTTQSPQCYVNHSCEPNTGLRNVTELYALCDIKAGEEVTYDYSATMNEDDWEMDCRCGAPSCRGRIRDFKYLSRELQQRYLQLGIVAAFCLKPRLSRSLPHRPLIQVSSIVRPPDGIGADRSTRARAPDGRGRCKTVGTKGLTANLANLTPTPPLHKSLTPHPSRSEAGWGEGKGERGQGGEAPTICTNCNGACCCQNGVQGLISTPFLTPEDVERIKEATGMDESEFAIESVRGESIGTPALDIIQEDGKIYLILHTELCSINQAVLDAYVQYAQAHLIPLIKPHIREYTTINMELITHRKWQKLAPHSLDKTPHPRIYHYQHGIDYPSQVAKARGN
ncbi:SET domain-containing protein [Candidatus Poribacteria bacterium]|nr:SET domain-containing protein [Candidatus Poribacteria bacterium]